MGHCAHFRQILPMAVMSSTVSIIKYIIHLRIDINSLDADVPTIFGRGVSGWVESEQLCQKKNSSQVDEG